jgi:hypothetical protein
VTTFQPQSIEFNIDEYRSADKTEYIRGPVELRAYVVLADAKPLEITTHLKRDEVAALYDVLERVGQRVAGEVASLKSAEATPFPGKVWDVKVEH